MVFAAQKYVVTSASYLGCLLHPIEDDFLHPIEDDFLHPIEDDLLLFHKASDSYRLS